MIHFVKLQPCEAIELFFPCFLEREKKILKRNNLKDFL